MIRSLTAFAFACAVALAAGTAAAGDPAADAVTQHLRKTGRDKGLLEAPQVFQGDFSGDGVPDAVAFFQTAIPGAASGFNSNILALQRKPDGSYAVAKDLKEQVAAEVRNVRISKGAVEFEHTVWKPTDPHCCPTGTKRSRVALPAARDSGPEGGTNAGTKAGTNAGTRIPAWPSSDDQTRRNFQHFIKSSTPQAYWETQATLDRMTDAQIQANDGPLGQAFSVAGQPRVMTSAGREGTTNNGEHCREFEATVVDARYQFVGCRASAADSPWRYFR